MSYGQDRQTISIEKTNQAAVDAGLRAYMLRVYNYMALGLVVTGLIAFAASQSMPFMQAIHGSALKFVVMFAPIGIMLFVSFRMERLSYGAMQMGYWLFTAILGLSMSYIFLRYTGESIAETFFVTAAAFGGLSLYGYTTRRSLSGMGTFLIMGLIGIIIASIVNIFLGSGMMAFIINALGVVIFAGLTAYDTQNIKNSYHEAYGQESLNKMALMGSWSLYLNFLNLFQFLLAFMGMGSSDD